MSVMAMECSRVAAVTISAVAALDDPSYLLLHEIRLRGVVEIAGDDQVGRLTALGLVTRASRGVRITIEGRAVNAAWARLELGSEAEAVVQRAYERFLPLNRELLRVCHDWQSGPGDWAVFDRARALDDRMAPITRRVAATVARFAVYRPQLREALRRVETGEKDWLTSPRIDSYHTVWMRLHEDFLLALGAEREP
jgi:hypothetical protein